jgi:hypothetical protein
VALIVGRAVAGLGTGGIFSGAVVIMAYSCKSLTTSSPTNGCFPVSVPTSSDLIIPITIWLSGLSAD